MTKRVRTILFFFLALSFLLVTPAVVLYSQGWRFDFATKKFTKTGGLFFKAWPQGASVNIDGELIKKTDIIFGNAFVENLVPRFYKVEITKENYQPWEKTLEVKAKLVTDAKNIYLFSANPSFQQIIQNVKSFQPSPDNSKILIEKPVKNNWYLSLFEPDTQVQSFIVEKTGEIIKTTWSEDSQKVLLETSSNERVLNYIIETNQVPPNIISLDAISADTSNFSFNPQNSAEIFYLKSGSLFKTNYISKETSQVIPSVVVSYETNDKYLYFLDGNGFLYQTDYLFGFQNKINTVPLKIINETEYLIYSFDPYFFIKDGDNMLMMNIESKAFEQLLETSKPPRLSPDGKKIVCYNSNEIWVLYTSDSLSQPEHKMGDKVFLTRFSENIGDLFWLNSFYLVFNVGDKIKISEIDSRDYLNVFDFKEFSSTNNTVTNIGFSPNSRDKKLYVLNGGNLYSSEKIVP